MKTASCDTACASSGETLSITWSICKAMSRTPARSP
jgi:hypothetical protein